MNQYGYFFNPPHSYWLATTRETNFPQLSEDISTDIAIIGGGMAGILCASLLSSEGLDVVILEAGRIAGGTTAHTTAKITSQHGLIYNKIKKQLGLDYAKQYADANETAIRIIKKMIEENGIDCDLSSQSAYIYTQQEKNIKQIEEEVKTASELGIPSYYKKKIPLPISIKAAVRFDGQAQFHPRKFLLSLGDKLHHKGVRIFEQSRAVDMEKGRHQYIIKTEEGKKVNAEKVILASHYPFYQKKGMYYSRLYTERAYIVAVKAKEKYPGGMYINAEDPARSFRGLEDKSGEMILVVGENHKTGQGKDLVKHYHNLISFARSVFTVEDIPFRWSAQDCMTLDGIPYVGNTSPDTPNLYIATGFEKWGMTNSMVSALILKDLIVKGENPWQEVYSPSRRNISGSAKNFIVENLDVAKHLIGGKIAKIPEDIKLERGEGSVVEVNGKRVGAYRDNKDTLHLVNSTCTHMGCELNWNSAEASWDCPCHGSRFTYSGDIIEGPSVKPLTSDSNVHTVKKVIQDDF